MNTYGTRIRPHVDTELAAAAQSEAAGEFQLAFRHLERAHVIGQASTVQHVRAHWGMLRWAVRRGYLRECFGQVLRIVGAATKTAVGLVPEGNTGGANVSPFRRMPVPEDLAALIRASRRMP